MQGRKNRATLVAGESRTFTHEGRVTDHPDMVDAFTKRSDMIFMGHIASRDGLTD